MKSGDKKYPFRRSLPLSGVYAALDSGKAAHARWSARRGRTGPLRDLFLLTDKPIIYVANICGEMISGSTADNLPLCEAAPGNMPAAGAGPECCPSRAKVEEELSGLESEEKATLHAGIGNCRNPALTSWCKKCYSPFGPHQLISRPGKHEVRAWTITKGTKAPQAAGKIHTDFERGFIKAEVISFDALEETGSAICSRQGKRAWSARRARNMSCRTAMSCCLNLMSD